jgi:hypothetical protein
MKLTRLLILFAIAVAPAAPALAAAEPTVRIVSYGRYDTQFTGRSEKNDRIAGGEIRTVKVRRLIEQTDEIAGMRDVSFGLTLKFESFPPGPIDLTIRVLHPPVTNPATGQTLTVSEYQRRLTAREDAYFGFDFGQDWLIAEGAWTYQFVYKGRVVAEKTFKVVVPLN